MPKVVQKQQIARALGISPPRVTALIARGMPTDSIPSARAWFEVNVRRYTKPARPGITHESPDRQRLRAAEANLLELEFAKRTGELVDKSTVERRAYQAGKSIQHALLEVLPGRVSHAIAATDDPKVAESVLRAALQDALSEWLPKSEAAP